MPLTESAEPHSAARTVISDSDGRSPNLTAGSAASPPVQPAPAARPGWQIVKLAVPSFAEYMIAFAIGLIDTYLAGHINKEATAAVGTGAYFGWFITLIFMVVSTSVAALISRAVGQRDSETANRVLNQGLLLGLLLGVAVSLGTVFSAPYVAAQFSQTPLAREYCARFLQIDGCSYTLASLMYVGGAALRASGNTRAPMMIVGGVSVVNAILAWSLVKSGGGVTGLALATMTARMLGGVVMLVVLVHGISGLRVQAALLRISRDLLTRMLRIGVPGGVDAWANILIQATFMSIVAGSALGEAGTVNYAAHMIAIRIETISTLLATAWMTASATLAGQALGAGDPARATRIGHTAALQTAMLCALAGVGIFFGADALYAQMTADEQVRQVGAQTIRYLAFIEPVLGAAIVYVGTLRGVGDTRTTMLISLASGCLVRLPIAYLGAVVFKGGLLGAWIGMFSDNIFRFALALTRYLHGGWRRIRV